MNTNIFRVAIGVLFVTLCSLAEAQQPKKVARIGYLLMGSVSSSLPRREAFREGLRNLGYVEGQNIIIE
jgi:hypothetical protein